jgi:Arc/MetJ family transcription regulator
MRTNIEIDDKLMKQAIRASGAKSKREAVDYALKLVVRVAEQKRLLRETKGKLHWDGNLEEMRRDRPLGK